MKSFSCLDQFLCMAFAQLTYRESLRDIEACLRAQRSKLYHLGIRGTVARNTLANANAVRDWRIYADFAQSLIGIARPLYVDEPFGVDLERHGLRAGLPPPSICACRCFPGHRSAIDQGSGQAAHAAGSARQYPDLHPHQRRQAARGQYPRSVGARARCLLRHGSRLSRFRTAYRFHQAGSFFVTRAKSNLKVQRRYSHTVDRSTGLICDQTIVLTGFYSRKGFPAPLRRIRFKDPETDKTLIFLTNNFALPALTITELYRCRWQVELFFKWIKQHLRIKAFFATIAIRSTACENRHGRNRRQSAIPLRITLGR